VLTTIALFLGLAVVNIVKPGVGVTLSATTRPVPATAAPTLTSMMEHTVPASIIDAMAKNEVLQVVVSVFCSEQPARPSETKRGR